LWRGLARARRAQLGAQNKAYPNKKLQREDVDSKTREALSQLTADGPLG
jgi:hypothetical protein